MRNHQTNYKYTKDRTISGLSFTFTLLSENLSFRHKFDQEYGIYKLEIERNMNRKWKLSTPVSTKKSLPFTQIQNLKPKLTTGVAFKFKGCDTLPPS